MKKTLKEYANEHADVMGYPPKTRPKAITHFIKMCKRLKLSEEKIVALIRRAKITEKMAALADAEDWDEERYYEVIESEILWTDEP